MRATPVDGAPRGSGGGVGISRKEGGGGELGVSQPGHARKVPCTSASMEGGVGQQRDRVVMLAASSSGLRAQQTSSRLGARHLDDAHRVGDDVGDARGSAPHQRRARQSPRQVGPAWVEASKGGRAPVETVATTKRDGRGSCGPCGEVLYARAGARGVSIARSTWRLAVVPHREC